MSTVPKLPRDRGVRALAKYWEPGEHLTMIGPTGRGKTFFLAQLMGAARHDRSVILCPKGADPALQSVGAATDRWPPKAPLVDRIRGVWNDEPDVTTWRLEIPVKQLADFGAIAAVYRDVLASALARKEGSTDSVCIVLDDSRLISDQMGLQRLVVANLLIARSKRASLVNMYQSPKWVPREAMDQASHVLIWRNRDRDVVKRLGEIGDFDPVEMRGLIQSLDFHELLWIDARRDRAFIIGQ